MIESDHLFQACKSTETALIVPLNTTGCEMWEEVFASEQAYCNADHPHVTLTPGNWIVSALFDPGGEKWKELSCNTVTCS